MSLQETLVKMTSTEAADVNELQNDDSNKSEVSHRSRRSRSSKRSLCKSLSVKSESLSSCKAALQAKQSFEADQRKLLQEEIKAQQRRTALRRQQIALQEEQEQEELKQKALAMERTNLTTRQKLAEIDAAMEMLDHDCSEQDEEVSFKGLREEKKGEGMQRFFDSQEKIQTPPLCPDEHQPTDSASRLTNPGVPAGWERIATSLEGCLAQLTRVAIGQSAASNQLAVSSQLPRIDVPVFSGDPLKYTLWKNAFDCLVDSKPVSDVSKLNYLNAYVSGKAKDIVEHHLLIGAEDGYQEARRQLEMRFGDPSTIGVSYSRKLSSWPKIASRDAAGLRDFADFLQKVLAAKGKVHSLGILDFPQENVKLVDKLPGHLEGRWRDEVENWRRNQGTQSYPTFSVFAEFVRRAADKANIPEFEPLSREHKPNLPASRTRAHIFATTGHSDEPNSINSEISSRARHGPYSSCPYCDGDHPIDACDSFMNKSIEARKAFFRRKMLCLGCGTTDHHLIKNCPDRKKCKTCEKSHLTCLHFSQSRSNNNQMREPEEGSLTQVEPEEGTSNCTSVCLVPDQDGRDHCMIVPVWVRHKDQPSKETLEYAILDDQSNVSFISKRLCEKLDVEGKKTNLLLTTMHKTANIESERISGLEVLDFNKKNVIQLPTAFSRDTVPASRSQIPKPEVVKQWEHLRNIACDMMQYREDVEVSLLIGNDCTRAIRPREIITGGEDDPYAQRSLLGWGVVGRVCRTPGEIKSAACNKTSANTYPNFSFETKAKETLTELLQSSRWLRGPTFLHDRGQFQPPIQSEQPTLEESDPEVKRVSTHSTIAEPEKGFEVDRLRHISSWSHARNSIALCLRYKRNSQLKVAKKSNFQTVTKPLPKVDLSVADLQEAEMEIIRCLQRESFAADKAILQNLSARNESDRKTAKTRNEQIKTASSLYRLDPFIDGEVIIRVGGRINRANVSRELKHPIIKEDSEFQGNCPLGRVEKVFPSKDGHVRKVQLRMADKALDEDGRRKGQPTFLDRPVHKLVILIPAEETSREMLLNRKTREFPIKEPRSESDVSLYYI